MKRFTLLVPLLLLLVGTFLLSRRGGSPPAASDALDAVAASHPEHAEISRRLRYIPGADQLVNNPLDRAQLSDLALLLDDPTLPDAQAMPAVHGLLSSLAYIALGSRYPAGLNVEVTNALLGKNPRKVGYLPIDCPRINSNGELVDQHGTPYWFHSPLTGGLTITSAGPDRLMHTTDDVTMGD